MRHHLSTQPATRKPPAGAGAWAALGLALAAGLGCGGGGQGGPVTGAAGAPDFSLEVEPPVLSIPAGASASLVVNISRFNGLQETVGLAGLNLPPGLTVAPAPPGSASPQGILVSVDPGVTPQAYPDILIQGKTGGIAHVQPLSIVVTAPARPGSWGPLSVQAAGSYQTGGPYQDQNVDLEPVPAVIAGSANGFITVRNGYFPENPPAAR